jgi:O6-methylguanine-DNA--protein-cysteine methyltransferase
MTETMLTLLQDKMDTPLGPLWVLCDEQFNLRAVEWDEHRDRMETARRSLSPGRLSARRLPQSRRSEQ